MLFPVWNLVVLAAGASAAALDPGIRNIQLRAIDDGQAGPIATVIDITTVTVKGSTVTVQGGTITVTASFVAPTPTSDEGTITITITPTTPTPSPALTITLEGSTDSVTTVTVFPLTSTRVTTHPIGSLTSATVPFLSTGTAPRFSSGISSGVSGASLGLFPLPTSNSTLNISMTPTVAPKETDSGSATEKNLEPTAETSDPKNAGVVGAQVLLDRFLVGLGAAILVPMVLV